eukprot:scaffold114388_cov35-Prasinocladus_malaysianus.AAC.2
MDAITADVGRQSASLRWRLGALQYVHIRQVVEVSWRFQPPKVQPYIPIVAVFSSFIGQIRHSHKKIGGIREA